MASTGDVQHYEESFVLSVTEVKAKPGMTGTGESRNCVFFSSAPGFRAFAGAGEASWTPSAPTSTNLEIVAQRGGAGNVVRSTGPSPASVEFERSAFADGDEGFVFVQLPRPDASTTGRVRAAVEDVELTIAFDFEGTPPHARIGGCTMP